MFLMYAISYACFLGWTMLFVMFNFTQFGYSLFSHWLNVQRNFNNIFVVENASLFNTNLLYWNSFQLHAYFLLHYIRAYKPSILSFGQQTHHPDHYCQYQHPSPVPLSTWCPPPQKKPAPDKNCPVMVSSVNNRVGH